MHLFNHRAHHYPIVIMVKPSNHMFAYWRFSFLSISCLIYFIVDYYYYYNDGWLLYGRLFVLMCTNHNPSSTTERRRKRIFFFSFSNEEGEREKGRWRANISILFSTFLLLCTTICQPFLNSSRKPHTIGRFLSSVLFRPYPGLASL